MEAIRTEVLCRCGRKTEVTVRKPRLFQARFVTFQCSGCNLQIEAKLKVSPFRAGRIEYTCREVA
jgi:hypothetical protein